MRAALLCLLLCALPCAAQLSLKSALYPPLLFGSTPAADTNPPVPGFTLWLHADDTTSVLTNKGTTNIAGATQATSGSRVGTWLDRSLIAATNHLYNFDGESGGNDRRPTLSNNWYNGKPTVVFPGGALSGQARLMSLTNNITFGATTNISILLVGSLDPGGDSFNDLLVLDRDKFFLRRDNANNKMEFGVTGWVTTAGTFTQGKGYVWIGVYYGVGSADNPASSPGTMSYWKLYRNGNTPDVLEFACCAVGKDFYAVGGNGATTPSVDQWLSGTISEAVIWPFALTATQVSNVNFYATNKYNMAP